jgi:hypothetical protein
MDLHAHAFRLQEQMRAGRYVDRRWRLLRENHRRREKSCEEKECSHNPKRIAEECESPDNTGDDLHFPLYR